VHPVFCTQDVVQTCDPIANVYVSTAIHESDSFDSDSG